MPFKLAFIDDDWFYLEISVDCLFFMDIIFNMNTAIYNHEGQLITDRRRIFIKYLKT